MEPITIAKTAMTVAKLLFATDRNGEAGYTKLAKGVAIGFAIFALLFHSAIQIFLLPVNELIRFFKPKSITQGKSIVNQDFVCPIISTTQIGLLSFPVINSRISSMYGELRNLSVRGGWHTHEGIDFAVAFETPVMAVAPGTVYDCGINKDYGEFIILEHTMTRYDEDGEELGEETFYTLYAHLYKQYVFRTQKIEQGRKIALSGGDPALHFSGNSTGPHLHLEFRKTPEYSSHFDPYDYLFDPKPFADKTKSIEWTI